MQTYQELSDKVAISLSVLCAIHCFALPFLILLLPSMLVLPFEEEAFHFWLMVIVLPISIYALTMGCKQHRRYQVVVLGTFGLLILVATALAGENLGEQNEKYMTLVGTSMIALSHFWNHRICRRCCDCQDGATVES